MATIALHVRKPTILEKTLKGADIITKSTNNPDVPGNATSLAAFSTAQNALVAANAAYEGLLQQADQLRVVRDGALEDWYTALNGLAGVTVNATTGVADKILSAGFDVRREPVRRRPMPVPQIDNVKVSYTDRPGYSQVTWKEEAEADAYVLQLCADPMTEAGWKDLDPVTEPVFVGNGVTPGQKYWYRVAGVGSLGRGAWSEPALRPVM